MCHKKGMKAVVVGVPKTIDNNDILLMDKTFGFDTAVEEAQRVINSAYIKNLLEKTNATDAGGNPALGDIGVHIQQERKKYFNKIGIPLDVKYIDPTYMIHACRANASDGILCTVLGQNAVHGAFAGFSGITVGICNTHYAYFPIPEVISSLKKVDPNSRMWHRCLTSTGQPDFM